MASSTASIADTPTGDTRTLPTPTARLRLGRINHRLMLLLVTSIAGITIALTMLPSLGQAPGVSRADAAWTARLEGAATRYEAARQARSNEAWTARLDTEAARHGVPTTQSTVDREQAATTMLLRHRLVPDARFDDAALHNLQRSGLVPRGSAQD